MICYACGNPFLVLRLVPKQQLAWHASVRPRFSALHHGWMRAWGQPPGYIICNPSDRAHSPVSIAGVSGSGLISFLTCVDSFTLPYQLTKVCPSFLAGNYRHYQCSLWVSLNVNSDEVCKDLWLSIHPWHSLTVAALFQQQRVTYAGRDVGQDKFLGRILPGNAPSDIVAEDANEVKVKALQISRCHETTGV